MKPAADPQLALPLSPYPDVLPNGRYGWPELAAEDEAKRLAEAERVVQEEEVPIHIYEDHESPWRKSLVERKLRIAVFGIRRSWDKSAKCFRAASDCYTVTLYPIEKDYTPPVEWWTPASTPPPNDPPKGLD